MTLSELAKRLGATVVGRGDVQVTGCAPITTARSDQLTFLANSRYARFLETTRAAAVITDASTECGEHVTRLVCDDPYFAFRNALIELEGFRRHPAPMDVAGGDEAGREPVISPLASIHPSAAVGAGTLVHPHAVVEARATVGENCVLYPGVFIGPDSRVGDDCILYPSVTVYDRCRIGDRVTLHSSTVIGHDGFGYATHEGVHHKIPQTGIVIVEDDVEMGAGCAIERAAMGETRVGRGTKLADLISIGHGTTVGAHCLFVSLVGISGSVEVGDHVVLGGQVGVTGHLKIGDGVQAAGKTAIAHDVPAGRKIGGVPAVDIAVAKRNALAGQNLHDLFKRVRQLERQLGRLQEQIDAETIATRPSP